MATEAVTSSGGSGAGASGGGDLALGSLSFVKRRGDAHLSRSGSRVDEVPSPSLTRLESQIEFGKLERRNLLDSRKDMLASMNAYSVVLVLLASITFVGFLQPPGGLKQDGTAAAGTLQRPGFYTNNYIVPLTISFYLAVAGILVCMSCIIFVLRLPQKSLDLGRERFYESDADKNSSLQEEIKMLHVSLKWAGVQEVMINAFFTFSLFCCTLAFVYAGYTVTDGEQHILLRRVLYVFETINGILFVSYTISLILSSFVATPLCYYVQLFIEWLIKPCKALLGFKRQMRLTDQGDR